MPIFHYALNLPGFLVLGSAETVGESTDLFDPINRAHKIFSKKPATSRPHFHLSFDVNRPMPPAAFRANAQGPLPSDFHREADRLVRAQGNRSGRQRMRQDSTLRPAKPPRGLLLSTGEDVPRGHSLRPPFRR